MAEQLHQCLKAYTGVDQGRGVGMAQLMRRDHVQSGRLGNRGQLLAQCAPRDPPALVGQQELHQSAAAWVAERAPRRTVGGDTIDDHQRLVIQRHHPLGIQLPERDLEPGALAWYLMHAVELQVHQLTDA
jgi:hypothetical protein